MLVKGYKGMHSDMTCRNMKYEIGKTYHAEGTVKLCSNGFHFCRKLTDVFDYYDRKNGNRFFEIEAEEVDNDGAKSVASSMRIIRELSAIQVNRAFEEFGGGYGDGDGNGYGNGYGYGYGDSDGYGYGNGYGYGGGYGTKIMLFE